MNNTRLLETYEKLEDIQKQAAFRDAFRHGLTGLKTLAGLGTGAYLAESTGRFLTGGDFHAPATSKALAAGATALLNGTQVGPLLAAGSRSVADGMLNSNAVQSMAGSVNGVVDKLNNGVTKIHELVSNPEAPAKLTEAAGQAGNEFAKGFAGQTLADSAAKVYTDPKGLAGMLALSIVPPAVLGLMHQRKRDESARVNREILQALVSKKKESRLKEKSAGLDWRRIRFGPAGASQWHKQQILRHLGEGKPMTPYAQRILQDLQKYKWYNPSTWGINQHPVYNSPWKSLALVGGTGGALNVLRDHFGEADTPLKALGLQGKAALNWLRRGPLFMEETALDVRNRMNRDGLFDGISLNNTEGGRNVRQVVDNIKTLGSNAAAVKDKLFPPVSASTQIASVPDVSESQLTEVAPNTLVSGPAKSQPAAGGGNSLTGWIDSLSPNQKIGLGATAFAGVPLLASYAFDRWIRRNEDRDKLKAKKLTSRLLAQ